jgi:ABC-type Mn2+/Zn2+ transport system permease subunit
MDINQKTANIPFWVLYGVAAGIALFDLIFTYTFLSSNPEAYEGNPINAYLADIIGLEYFLFMIPVSLLVLYGITKLGAWAIRRVDKTTEINGEKYMAVILILLTFPNVLLNEIFLILFGSQLHVSRFDPALVLAIVLTLSYILWTEMADRKAKKKKTETAV